MDVERLYSEIHEECGVFAAWGVENAARTACIALQHLQHRGQQGCGIAAAAPDGTIRLYKAPGLVRNVFTEEVLSTLPGSSCIGHVRYPTTDVGGRENIQPFRMTDRKGPFAVAHNGNIVNAAVLRNHLEAEGALSLSTSDSEIFGHLIGRGHPDADRTADILSATRMLDGGFSTVILTPDAIYACRDRYGLRPLSVGTLGDGYVVASETCAFRGLGARFLRDIDPGELVRIDRHGIRSFPHPDAHQGCLCAMEFIYFARPDSVLEGCGAYSFRERSGHLLCQEHPVEADLVTGIPESGLAAAIGYAAESGLPLEMGLIKNMYVARTFIQPAQHLRDLAVRMKFSPMDDIVRGKRIVVVDDSIVRGTTLRQLVRMFRDAGATQIHIRIASPKYAFPCYYGIDTGSREQLIGADHDVPDICRYLGADSLAYLSEEALYRASGRKRLCTACFSGHYPTDLYQT